MITDSKTGKVVFTNLTAEPGFKKKFNASKNILYMQINMMKMTNKNDTFYRVYKGVPTSLRRYQHALRLQLNQSILYEDIAAIITALKKAVRTRDNSGFDIDYWGQKQFIRNESVTSNYVYWQPLFYVTPETSNFLVKHQTNCNSNAPVLIPENDYSVDSRVMVLFFNSYVSARGNKFQSNLGEIASTDFIVEDLFILSCFGPVMPENFRQIFNTTFRMWNEAYGLRIKFFFYFSCSQKSK